MIKNEKNKQLCDILISMWTDLKTGSSVCHHKYLCWIPKIQHIKWLSWWLPNDNVSAMHL